MNDLDFEECTLTYGTFDVLHYGHIRLLRRAADFGQPVVVGLSTDNFNLLKGKKAFLSYREREELLLELKVVKYVFPEESWEQKRQDIRTYNATRFVIGEDWQGKFDELSDVTSVIYLERTDDISSTEIRKIVNN